jgi:hypothetical protein
MLARMRNLFLINAFMFTHALSSWVVHLLAFDSKDFGRRKIIQEVDPVTSEPIVTEMTKYYTPLGVGVRFKDPVAFKDDCLHRIELLANEFELSQKRIMYDSYSLKVELSNTRAIPFCDKLVSKLTEYIDLLHFSYVVMPPDLHPTVKVGGFKSPAYEIRSAVFLRNLAPMFPHIAAWSYFGIEREAEGELLLDGFNSKETQAWNYLIAKTKPKIFPHGDECNPYIMIADIIAYLTDAKLYGQKLKLKRENLQKIWEPYGFEVDSHFLDYETHAVYGWNSEDQIDTAPYLAHPMTFLLVDELEKLQPNPPPAIMEEEDEEELSGSEEPLVTTSEEKRFSKLVRRMEPWYAVTAYAYYKGGGAQLFNFHMDRRKVQDGDTMVYIGHQSKALAEGIADMLDIEVLSAKEIRKAVNREKANH